MEAVLRKQAPAVVLAFARDMTRMRRATLTHDGRLVDDRGEVSPLVPVPLGPEPAGLQDLARRGVGELDSPTADRLFGWLLRLGFEPYLEDPDRPSNMYSKRIMGGCRAIAAELGLRTKKAPGEVSALLDALNACWLGWNVPGDQGRPLPLVHVRETIPAAPGRPESFVLGLSPLCKPSAKAAGLISQRT